MERGSWRNMVKLWRFSKFLTGWSNWQDLQPYMWRWTIQPVLQRRLRFTVTGDIYLFKVHKEWVSLVALQCRRSGFHPWAGKIPWRSEWQPTTVFLPGESHGLEEPGRLQGSHGVTKSQTWLSNEYTHMKNSVDEVHEVCGCWTANKMTGRRRLFFFFWLSAMWILS